MSYQDFLARKMQLDTPTGLKIVPAINPMLYPHQADMVK